MTLGRGTNQSLTAPRSDQSSGEKCPDSPQEMMGPILTYLLLRNKNRKKNTVKKLLFYP